MVEWGYSEEVGGERRRGGCPPPPLIKRDTVRIQWVYSEEEGRKRRRRPGRRHTFIEKTETNLCKHC